MIGVDSDILIDILRNRAAASVLRKYADEELVTSEIVVYELLYGLFASRHFISRRFNELEAVLDTFAYVFPIERKASVWAAKIGGKLAKSGQMIEHRDALIAGSLIANGCKKLITKNVKDFEKIKELEIVTVI